MLRARGDRAETLSRQDAEERQGRGSSAQTKRRWTLALCVLLACSSERVPEAGTPAAPATPTPAKTAAISADPAPATAAPAPEAARSAETQSGAAAGGGEWPAIDLRACGLVLHHPPDWFASSNRISKDPLRAVELLEDTQELRDLLS